MAGSLARCLAAAARFCKVAWCHPGAAADIQDVRVPIDLAERGECIGGIRTAEVLGDTPSRLQDAGASGRFGTSCVWVCILNPPHEPPRVDR